MEISSYVVYMMDMSNIFDDICIVELFYEYIDKPCIFSCVCSLFNHNECFMKRFDVAKHDPNNISKNYKIRHLMFFDINVDILIISKLKIFSRLYALDINRCGLTTLDGVKDLKFLTTLNFPNNQIFNLNDVKWLINLKHIDCSNNKIKNLYPLKKLEKLESIDCSLNFIYKCPMRHIKTVVYKPSFGGKPKVLPKV